MDFETLIGAVRREVTTRDHNGAPARVVIAERDYATDIDDLWDALTNAERLPRWFAPVRGDLVLGGAFQVEGNASGEIETCDRPEHLGVTWGMHGDVSWVDIYLDEQAPSVTRLRLEHTAHVPEEFWTQFGPGAVGVGWDLALLGLSMHIDHEADRDGFDEHAWAASPEGRHFVAGTAASWGDAAVAAGDDEQSAREAAGRTKDFYSPPEA